MTKTLQPTLGIVSSSMGLMKKLFWEQIQWPQCETARRHVDWDCKKHKVTDRETGFIKKGDVNTLWLHLIVSQQVCLVLQQGWITPFFVKKNTFTLTVGLWLHQLSEGFVVVPRHKTSNSLMKQHMWTATVVHSTAFVLAGQRCWHSDDKDDMYGYRPG